MSKRCKAHGKWYAKVCSDCEIDNEAERRKQEIAASKCNGCDWGRNVGNGKFTCLMVMGCVKT